MSNLSERGVCDMKSVVWLTEVFLSLYLWQSGLISSQPSNRNQRHLTQSLCHVPTCGRYFRPNRMSSSCSVSAFSTRYYWPMTSSTVTVCETSKTFPGCTAVFSSFSNRKFVLCLWSFQREFYLLIDFNFRGLPPFNLPSFSLINPVVFHSLKFLRLYEKLF